MFELRGGFGRDFDELQREMERFLGHLSRGKHPVAVPAACGWRPAVDVYETPSEIVVLVEAAGVEEEEIEAQVDGRTLLIRGQRLPRVRSQRQTYHQLEIGFGPFERTIELPVPVDAERASASYQDGFLEIVLPKVEGVVGRRVTIKTEVPK